MCLNAHPNRLDAESETLIPVNRCDIDVARSLTARADGSPCADRRPNIVFSIQERAVSENIDAGPQGSGIGEDVAFTLEARNKVQAVAYSIMPQNSGKDYKAREVDVSQPLMASGPVTGNQGGDVIAYRSTGSSGTFSTGDAVGALTNTNDPNAQFIAFAQNQRDELRTMESAGSLAADPGMKQQTFIAYDMRGREGGAKMEGPHDSAALRAGDGGASRSFVAGMGVRRLTPVECMRLQSFPDDYFDGVMLRGKQMADGPIYKCLGNSMNVKMMAWVARRIDASMARMAALRANTDGVKGAGEER